MRPASICVFAAWGLFVCSTAEKGHARQAPEELSESSTELEPDNDVRERVILEGSVLAPDGSPAEGAVVFSSAGGQAVTDTSGRYRLEVEVPLEATRAQITAVASAEQLAASVSVPLSASARVMPTVVGTLRLALGTSCPKSWLPTFGVEEGTSSDVFALAVYDDGGGPGLYVGGCFLSAGGLPASRIAKWDGSTWSALGSGIGGTQAEVLALAVYDDGNGPALYVGGGFSSAGGVAASNIARWDGSGWSTLGSGLGDGRVSELEVYDDGNGPALYAGGEFSSAGGMAIGGLAKWDGSTWSGLGGIGLVIAMEVYDDGNGPALYAGGSFSSAGGVAASNIARWDGSSWSALGSGLGGFVRALEVFDDGSGPALYAGGGFSNAGGVAVDDMAKWDGMNWSAVPSLPPTENAPLSLMAFDDGNGPALYVGTAAPGLGNPEGGVLRLDDSIWTVIGRGNGLVLTLGVYDDGNGAALYAAGPRELDTFSGVAAHRIAKWNGSVWSALGSGMNGDAYALVLHDDGGGTALYAGGGFRSAGGVQVNGIGRWNGSTWSALGSGMSGNVRALAVHDDGGGVALYAGGLFTAAGGVAASNIAKWDGSSWKALDGGTDDRVYALASYDDGSGPALFAGGEFLSAGGVPADRIARWDGSTWSALGSGLSSTVRALAVHDDGSGPALYAGGMFTIAGGIPADRIARWDGSTWSALGTGTSGGVRALVVHDDGSGPALYAGGAFMNAGGAPVNRIARWNGSTWSALGSGVNDSVLGLTVHDDGNGPALYAGGVFTSAGGMAANRIARWDGSWSALGSGMGGSYQEDSVHALMSHDDGNGPALYAGGNFTTIDSGDSNIAKWGCAAQTPETYCTGKTTSALCVPFLSFGGSPSATAGHFNIISTDHIEFGIGLYFYGLQKSNLDFHGGTLCVRAPFQRISTLIKATDGIPCTACAGNCRMFKRNFNQLIQSGADPMLTPGQDVRVQVRQRDDLDPTGFGDNLSNGLSFVVGL